MTRKSPDQLIHNVKLLMKDNYEAVGFIPEPRLEWYEARGRIWHQYDEGVWVGYLLPGPARPAKTCRIWQECIDKSARRFGSGARLYAGFEAFCRNHAVSDISLRCAEGLDSNVFWRAMGFELVGCDLTENARKRKVFRYRKVLDMQVFPWMLNAVHAEERRAKP